MRKSLKSNRINWVKAPDVAKRVRFLLATCEITWIKASKLHFIRSYYAKTRAVARIWGLNRVWQMALGESPSYVIEVISERFDKLSEIEKDKVLLHELTHIPKNFSGALMPHIRRGKRSFHDKVHKLIGDYLSKRQK